LGYTLPSYASSAKVNIYDSNGTLVKTIDEIPLAQGENKLFWDFTDSNGAKVPAGKYSAKLEAVNASTEESMEIQLFKYGTIDGVRFGENGTVLVVDSTEYNLSDIVEIVKSK